MPPESGKNFHDFPKLPQYLTRAVVEECPQDLAERLNETPGAFLGDCLEELVGESSKLPGDFDPIPGGILRRSPWGILREVVQSDWGILERPLGSS